MIGYLLRNFPDGALLDRLDDQRTALGEVTLRNLDGAARFSTAQHTRGDNASALIFAASFGDFLALDRGAVDVVAVTGNSMGWYSTLACAGALLPEEGFRVANTMGMLMQRLLIGGQVIHPFVDEDWRVLPGKRAELLGIMERVAASGQALHLSIDIGGCWSLPGRSVP